MLKVLIAEENEEFRCALAENMRGLYHVRTCRNGSEALELLHSFLPDVLVLDLLLPELDGISLLQSAASTGIRPAVLATTRYCSDYISDALNVLGVGYLMMKPCDVHATVCRVADLSQRMNGPLFSSLDPGTAASNLLVALGIPTKLHGYAYLREAVLLMAQKPGQSITKELYPAVGKRCGATGAQVERSIRAAIMAGWSGGDRQLWKIYFGAAGVSARPTNGAFICRLAEAVKRETGGADIRILAEG